MIWGGAEKINFTINVMLLNHPNSPPPHPWQNCLPRNQSLVLKSWGRLFMQIHSLCIVIYLSPSAKAICCFQTPVALFGNQGDGIIFSLTPGAVMELEPGNEVWTGWPMHAMCEQRLGKPCLVLPSLILLSQEQLAPYMSFSFSPSLRIKKTNSRAIYDWG